MGLRHYSAGIDFRRQILMTKVDLRAVRSKCDRFPYSTQIDTTQHFRN